MRTGRRNPSPATPIGKRLAPTVAKDAPESSSQILSLDLAVSSGGKRMSTLIVPAVYVTPKAPDGARPVTFDDIVIDAEQTSAVEFRTKDGLTFHLSEEPIGNGTYSYVHLVEKSDSVINQIYALKEIAIGTAGERVDEHRLYNFQSNPRARHKLTMTEAEVRNEVETAHALKTPLAPHFAIRVRKDENGRDNERIFLASPPVDQTALNLILAVHEKKKELESANPTLPEAQHARSDVNYALGVHLYFDGVHELARYHRERALLDIKPENILIDLSPIGKHSFGDFGLAQDVRGSAISSGTVGFMAPELLFEQPDFARLGRRIGFVQRQNISGAKADIFSFGRTLIEAVTGTLPFSFRTRADHPEDEAHLKEWLIHSDKLAVWAWGRRPMRELPQSSHEPINAYTRALQRESGKLMRILLTMTATDPSLRPPAHNMRNSATRLLDALTARDGEGRYVQRAEREYREVLRGLVSPSDRALMLSETVGDEHVRRRAARRLRNGVDEANWHAYEHYIKQEVATPRTLLAGMLRKHERNYNSLTSMRRSDWALPLGANTPSLAPVSERAAQSTTRLSPDAQFYVDMVFSAEFVRSPSLPAAMRNLTLDAAPKENEDVSGDVTDTTASTSK